MTSTADSNSNGESQRQPVVVSLKALAGNSLPLATLTDAFGPESLGIIVVRDLPPQFATLRLRLLQYASYLAHLPASELEKVTVARAKYLIGWSHGVETLRSGKKDSLKGSWYCNCAFYHGRHSAVHDGVSSGSLEARIADMAAAAAERDSEGDGGANNRSKSSSNDAADPDSAYADLPEYTSPNVWPPDELLPGFRQTLEDLCCLIIDVAVLVARQCDRFAVDAGIDGYAPGYLERVVSTSRTTKARLLHYFPPEAVTGDTGEIDDDDWCTTHKDHGCLTGLTSALFVDESRPLPPLDGDAVRKLDGPALATLAKSPDPDAGLYIRSRTGALTKVAIPPDCLAFQTGEALERITGGKFAAVPHFVRGPRSADAKSASVARNTLAVFTQPNLGEPVDERGTTFAEFARQIIGQNTVG